MFKLGWKRLTVTDTLAYYDMEFIMAVKGFLLRASGHAKNHFFNLEMSFFFFKISRDLLFSLCHRLIDVRLFWRQK
jgi:hypothetical protein